MSFWILAVEIFHKCVHVPTAVPRREDDEGTPCPHPILPEDMARVGSYITETSTPDPTK